MAFLSFSFSSVKWHFGKISLQLKPFNLLFFLKTIICHFLNNNLSFLSDSWIDLAQWGRFSLDSLMWWHQRVAGSGVIWRSTGLDVRDGPLSGLTVDADCQQETQLGLPNGVPRHGSSMWLGLLSVSCWGSQSRTQEGVFQDTQVEAARLLMTYSRRYQGITFAT